MLEFVVQYFAPLSLSLLLLKFEINIFIICNSFDDFFSYLPHLAPLCNVLTRKLADRQLSRKPDRQTDSETNVRESRRNDGVVDD